MKKLLISKSKRILERRRKSNKSRIWIEGWKRCSNKQARWPINTRKRINLLRGDQSLSLISNTTQILMSKWRQTTLTLRCRRMMLIWSLLKDQALAAIWSILMMVQLMIRNLSVCPKQPLRRKAQSKRTELIALHLLRAMVEVWKTVSLQLSREI